MALRVLEGGIRSSIAAGLVILAACTPPATRSGESLGPGAESPEAAVGELLAALAGGDFDRAVELTVPDQMVAVALVEGADIDEAIALLPSGGHPVGVNFWGEFSRSFSEFLGADPGDARAGTVVAFDAGGRRFARVEVSLPAKGVVRSLIVQEGEGWRIDVFASFASALAGRLGPVAADVSAAEGEAGIENVAALLRDLEPSLSAALESPDAGGELATAIEAALASIRDLPDGREAS